MNDGRNNLWPALIASLVILILMLIFYIIRYNFYRKKKRNKKELEKEGKEVEPIEKQQQQQPEKLYSIEAIRGLTVVCMIFINWSYGGYHHIFSHSEWDGLRLADLILPSFLFIMGISLAIRY